MKQKLRFILMTLLCAVFTSAWGAEVTDVLDKAFTGVTGTSYTEWSGKTATSNAVYAGQSAGGNGSIQLRSSNSNSGIVSTTSGGKVKSITVTWNSNTQTGRTLNIYGSNTPYTSPTDLYNSSKQGTLLGTIKYGTSTSLTISGDNVDYEYIGIRSASDALYLTSIEIVWEATVSAPTFSPEGGTYYSEQSVKISCKDENATIYYTLNGEDPTTESANFKGTGYVTIKVNTTLKAMAIDKDGNSSEIVSAIYTFKEMTSFENLTYLTVDTPADKYLVDPLNARVTYVYGQYAYIEDEDGGAILLEKKEGHGLTVGQTISGAAVVDFQLNNGNPQITNIDLTDCEVKDGDAPDPFEVAILNWDYDFSTILNKYFKVSGATITNEDDKFYVQLGGDKVQLFGKGDAKNIFVPDLTDTYTIIGFPTMDNTTKGLVIFVQPVGKAGTNDKPYTVAQARAAIDHGTGTTGVYATGIVSKIVTAYNNGYISYDISTDGSTTADQLRAYKGKSYNGANFTSADDIKVGDNVVIYGNLKKYSSIYEFDADNQLVSLVRPTIPIINVTSQKVELAYNATAGEIEYSIDNPVSGKSLLAAADANWISNITVTNEKVTFSTTVNEGETVRKATITLTYEGAKDVTVEVIQKLPDFATLPFAFNGGRADIENKAGLTQLGLGEDYSASPLLKFDGTGDYLILKINERPGKLTFDIKGNSFSGGTFKVQTSENGETYTDLVTYTEFGEKGNDYLPEEFENLGENVRYIKWIYTEKADKGGNVGLGNITLAKFTGLNPEISFGETNFTTTYGEPFTAPTLSNPHNVTVTYSSSNEDVASVNPETGEVSLNGVEGTATITATSIQNETYGVGQASYTIAVTVIQVDNDDVFELVSTNDLAAGDKIIIVNVKETTTPVDEETGTEATTQYSYMGLGVQTKNNRAAVEVNANNDGTLKGNNKLQVITLEVATKTNAETNEVTKTDNWWLNVGNGYLYAAGSNDNYLRTEETPDVNGRADAKITFNDEGDDDISIIFQTTATKRNNLKYNSSSKIFSCYETGQDPVKIYRKKGIPGDANNDGIVSVADVMLVVNYVLGNNPTNFNFKNANVNNDLKITVADVMAIVKIVLGN